MSEATADRASDAARWTLPAGRSIAAVNTLVTAPLLEPQAWAWRAWWLGVVVSLILTLMMAVAVIWVFMKGLGIWGINSTVVWGVAIANYVWWIGIGNAGTLISAMLLLTRQPWRGSINRFAEAMTLFAVAIAGIMPIIHLGRPIYAYWLAPYPNTMALWPQWRSALVWDFWAIVSYLLFSILFWYVSLIPDLATMRDRARSRARSTAYSRSAGAARRGTGIGSRSCIRQWPRSACHWWCRCTAWSGSISPPA